MNIEKISEDVKYIGPRFTVKSKKYIRKEDNLEYLRDVVEVKDAVVVLPIDEEENVYFVKQIREVIGEETLELPAGLIEDGENIKEAAIRELEEEIGMLAKEVCHLITVYSSCGFTTEKTHIYVAKKLNKTVQNFDKDENITGIVKIKLEECYNLINKNYFKQANMNLALLMYKNK